jgi:MFS family permease
MAPSGDLRLFFAGRECRQRCQGPYGSRPFCLHISAARRTPRNAKCIEGAHDLAFLSFLDRKLSVAHPGYSRWLVPPAALAIHLSIGQVYSFSAFKIPLTQLLGVGKSMPDDWKQTQIAWIFSLAIVMLGLSAATFGKWLEGAGPRKAMFASAICFALGFYISYLGVISHQLWLLHVGYRVVGGIGLGLGYISPVSTLIKWFPDRPGLATGMAIMGFGGGAMIGSPLAIKLMAYFRTSTDMGVGKTFLLMGIGATAIPVWSQNREILPPPFLTSGLGSSSGTLELLGFMVPATQILGFVASGLETFLGIFLEVRERPVDAPLQRGKSGWTLRIAGFVEGPASLLLRLFLAGSHRGRYAAAICFLAGALLNRYGWIWAGRASAQDPHALFQLQHKT